MANSLRDEVERLLDELIAADPDRAERFIESQLARVALRKRSAAIARHPAADGVVVPRRLLERLQFHSIGLSNITQSESHMFEITSDVTQADAILADGKA